MKLAGVTRGVALGLICLCLCSNSVTSAIALNERSYDERTSFAAMASAVGQSTSAPLQQQQSRRRRDNNQFKKPREILNRSYAANRKSFQQPKGSNEAFTADDLAYEKVSFLYSLWFRGTAAVLAYLIFPWIVDFVKPFSDEGNTAAITGALLPGIGILFGSMISITYSILLGQQSVLQEAVTKEASSLARLAHDCDLLLSKYEVDELAALVPAQLVSTQLVGSTKQKAFQLIWNHADVLVGQSRLNELLMMMNGNDHLASLLSLIDNFKRPPTPSVDTRHHNRKSGSTASDHIDLPPDEKESFNTDRILIEITRKTINDVMDARASRLNKEALSLPAIHFWIMTFLSLYHLTGFCFYTASNMKISNLDHPSFESNLMFATLATVFSLSINFAIDLNRPFEGAYQVRRSAVSCYLIQVYNRVKNYLV